MNMRDLVEEVSEKTGIPVRRLYKWIRKDKIAVCYPGERPYRIPVKEAARLNG